MEFVSESTITLVRQCANDHMVAAAARASTNTWASDMEDSDKLVGLIRYLMKNRHGSPFEHNLLTFCVDTPIFVAREFMRHRIGWSYNELSGRYSELPQVFYIPSEIRPLVQSGTSAHPQLSAGNTRHQEVVLDEFNSVYKTASEAYKFLLDCGIAREVARMVLPVGIMTRFYATCNARSLMSFLSLRVDSPESKYPTKPQYEIQRVAEAMERHFAKAMPITYEAFVMNGRVAP